jgi:outer membrane receptor for ferrienterochelin and colicin
MRTSADTGCHGGPGQVLLRWGLAVFLAATTPVSAAPAATDMLDLPLDDLLQLEIRSAGKREQQLRDIPASVSILTRAEIARYGYVTFEELMRNLPGFYVLDSISERVIGARGTAGGGVQLLINGVPQHQTRQ